MPAISQAYGGDCEDYAIWKYAQLSAMGFAHDDLRLVVVHDRRYRVDHAVLAVQLEGEWLILDNSSNAIVPAEAAAKWLKPVYAVNRDRHWQMIGAR